MTTLLLPIERGEQFRLDEPTAVRNRYAGFLLYGGVGPTPVIFGAKIVKKKTDAK